MHHLKYRIIHAWTRFLFLFHKLAQNPRSKETWKEIWTTLRRPMLYGIVGVVVSLIGIAIITYLLFIQDIQNKERIMNRSQSGLTLLDDTGQAFFSFYQPKEISYIGIDLVPKSTQDAVVASEDRDFYTNPGFSIKGIFRAIREDFQARTIVQGGSTITQELVKNALLTSEQTFLRKYQELVLAIELNRRYSKKDILELYLNSVYFGEGSFGIENASQTYFGIPARKLDLAQSTLLVGILPAPSAFSPLSNDPAIAKKRQQIVLENMVQAGYVTQKQADEAEQEKLAYTAKKTSDNNILAPHFAIMVKDELIKKYGEEQVIRSGFKVTTTLKRSWQEYAQDVVKNQVYYLRFNKVTNGAAVVLNPKTGEIKALVGSIDWSNPKFGTINMATTPRQPGSSFKPIIYADAFEEKLITPATLLDDKKITFPGGYTPQNFDGKFRGPVTVRRALSNSLNIPAIEVMQKVGVKQGVEFAQKLGISTLNPDHNYGLPLVLGAAEVKLTDMTNAYATFADGGVYKPLMDVTQIKDKYGNTIYTSSTNQHQVLGSDAAFLITSILSDDKARAEEFGTLLNIFRPAAVKTGTTNDFKDSLTIGYTPNLTVGVWVGNNDNTPMSQVAGAIGAAPIWRLLMTKFLADLPNEPFTKPFGIVEAKVCPYKGQKETPFATGSAVMDYFISGTQPKKSCEDPTPTPANTPTPTTTPKPTETPSPTQQQTPTPAPTNAPAPTATPLISPTATIPTVTVPPLLTVTPTP